MKHEIRLYDVIGEWGMTAEGLAASIPPDTDEITVRINSPGGAVGDGLAMYNYLRDHSAKVTTIVDGYAASAASIVMLAGDVRQVHESSIVVIHNPWTMAVGDGRDMRHTAETLDTLRTALIGIYTERTGMSGAELESALDDETWMRGPVALEYGFADEMIRYDEDEEGQMAASVQFARMLEIVNGGKELMSKQLTRRDIEAQADTVKSELADAQAALEAAKTEMTAEAEKLTVAHAAAVADLTVKIEAADAKTAETVEALDARDAEAVALAERVTGYEAQVADITAKLTDAAARADKAEAALKNPAVADATINAPEKTPDAALDAEADRAEKEAQAEKEASEPQDVAEEYESMEAGQARVDFWNAHKREILSIISTR